MPPRSGGDRTPLPPRAPARALALALLAAAAAGAGAGDPQRLHCPAEVAVSWDQETGAAGAAAPLRTRLPFRFRRPEIEAGPDTLLAFDCGRVYALSRGSGALTVIAARPWRPVRRHQLGAPGEFEDLAAAGGAVYLTRRGSARLLRLDPATGALRPGADLSPFADADGDPDLGAMLPHQGRLFVQVRRLNADEPGAFASPAMLAVVDLRTEALVDVDPRQPGLQAIALEGTPPKRSMQVAPGTRKLFVSATGGFFDAGGLEVIDLDTLRSEGLAIGEADGRTGADLGAFVMVRPDRGFLVFSTDFALSSHLLPFSLQDGVEPGPEMHVQLDYFVPALVHDPRTDTLFVPESVTGSRGILAFDVLTRRRLTPAAVPTGGPPTDLLLTPGPRCPRCRRAGG